MTTAKEGQKNEREEKGAVMGCCSPQKFAEMMARCSKEMKGECGAMMQEMMKGGCCPPEEK
jgi:hypothetical protein